jgi:hypothetical protein
MGSGLARSGRSLEIRIVFGKRVTVFVVGPSLSRLLNDGFPI